jgi:hypothetical protein
MFSFVLKLQAWLEKLKKNKGAWFTMLSTGAVLGILISMYYLNTMSGRTADKMYNGMVSTMLYEFDTKVNRATVRLTTASMLLLDNPQFVATFKNPADAAGIGAQLKKTSGELTKIDGSDVVMEFYNNQAVKVASSIEGAKITSLPSGYKSLQLAAEKNEPVSGFEFQDGAIWLHVVRPIGDGANRIGFLEIKNKVDYFVKMYKPSGFVLDFLMVKDGIDSKKLQEYQHKTIATAYASFQPQLDQEFLEEMDKVNYKELLTKKFILSKKYFITAKAFADASGNPAGLIVIGEEIIKESSLPKMASDISKGVTVGALALVVALLLLMI